MVLVALKWLFQRNFSCYCNHILSLVLLSEWRKSLELKSYALVVPRRLRACSCISFRYRLALVSLWPSAVLTKHNHRGKKEIRESTQQEVKPHGNDPLKGFWALVNISKVYHSLLGYRNQSLSADGDVHLTLARAFIVIFTIFCQYN